MKISQIVELDIKIEGNKEILESAMLRLPFFKDLEVEEIASDSIEKVLRKISKKYLLGIGYIFYNPIGGYYTVSINTYDTHKCLKTVYGMSLLEVLQKVILFSYAYVQCIKNKG